MKTMNIEQTTDLLIYVCDAIIDSKSYLTEIDSKIGDGDHGVGMSGGMEKAKVALQARRPFPDVNTAFKTMGLMMLNTMGGASGVIFGSLFLSGVKNMDTITELDGEKLTQILRNALEEIKARGGANIGDKTMIDALEPAVEAMESCDNKDLSSLLGTACIAADEGVENTKNYIARFGRAKSLMERAVGYQDAGATSVAIIFHAMVEYVDAL